MTQKHVRVKYDSVSRCIQSSYTLPSSADFMLAKCRVNSHQVQRTFPKRTTVSDKRFISQYNDDSRYL